MSGRRNYTIEEVGIEIDATRRRRDGDRIALGRLLNQAREMIKAESEDFYKDWVLYLVKHDFSETTADRYTAAATWLDEQIPRLGTISDDTINNIAKGAIDDLANGGYRDTGCA